MTDPQLGSSATPNVAADALRIAESLNEPLTWLIDNVIKVLGVARADTLLERVREIEAAGGMPTVAGDRQRTPGGVFLFLLKGEITPEEYAQIFSGGPKTKPPRLDDQGKPRGDPAPLMPLAWEDARAEVSRLIKLPMERVSVKITLVGRPSQVSKTKSCVVVAMKGSRPPSLPKGLPPAPDGSDFSYAVFISLRHWANVAPVMAQD